MSDIPNGNKIYDHGQRISALEVDFRNLKEDTSEIKASIKEIIKHIEDLSIKIMSVRASWTKLAGFSGICAAIGAALLKLASYIGMIKL